MKWPGTIREINDLPPAEKHAIYFTLLPDWILPNLGLGMDLHIAVEASLVKLRCPTGSNTMEFSIFRTPNVPDPVLYLQMGDTFNSQLIVLMIAVNDPDAPRFNVDVDENGQPTRLGTDGRNIPEEIRAMRAGLAPGQIRCGLRIFRSAIPIFESFVKNMGHDLFFMEPLFYHNAIIFERYGFTYSRGLQHMTTIHQEFQPGGQLHAQLDGSTPFRSSNAWQTISGRSWAIHDGILGEPFSNTQMYKRVGKHAGIQTFPNAAW
jgi:hypothetical protein